MQKFILSAFSVILLLFPVLPLYPFPSVASGQEPSLVPNTMETQAEMPLSERIVDYHITVALDSNTKVLEGMEIVTWKNPGLAEVSDLYFHLYPNAFKSPNSTFMKEKLKYEEWRKENQGQIDITSITTEDGQELAPLQQFVQPDDNNADDQTLMRIHLDSSILPNEMITLSLKFTVKLPLISRRMGQTGDFVMAGQWFPKLAVYEPVGMRGRDIEGWNLHQYHLNSEFYADFGTYDVRVQVPTDYNVVGSGELEQKKSIANGNEFHFIAKDIHDFAWSASTKLIYYEERFLLPQSSPITLKIYIDPQNNTYKDRYLNAAKKALKRFNEWYGPYPYPGLTIIVPPSKAAAAGAMEYPTLVTARAASGDTSLKLERTLIHEIAHQYWYGMVANNEFEEAWMDESFAMYSEDKVMKLDYGDAKMTQPTRSFSKKVIQNSWEFQNRFDYENNVYFRGKSMLDNIERLVGEKKMQELLHAYFDKWKFKHPNSNDFQAVMEAVTNVSWEAFLNQNLYNSEKLASGKSKQVETASEGNVMIP